MHAVRAVGGVQELEWQAREVGLERHVQTLREQLATRQAALDDATLQLAELRQQVAEAERARERAEGQLRGTAERLQVSTVLLEGVGRGWRGWLEGPVWLCEWNSHSRVEARQKAVTGVRYAARGLCSLRPRGVGPCFHLRAQSHVALLTEETSPQTVPSSTPFTCSPTFAVAVSFVAACAVGRGAGYLSSTTTQQSAFVVLRFACAVARGTADGGDVASQAAGHRGGRAGRARGAGAAGTGATAGHAAGALDGPALSLRRPWKG